MVKTKVTGSWESSAKLVTILIHGMSSFSLGLSRFLYKGISSIQRFCYPHTGETSAYLRTATTCDVVVWRPWNIIFLSWTKQEHHYCKESVKISVIDKLIAWTLPNTLILARNALSTIMLQGDIGATGSERPFRSFDDLNEPKWRLPWQLRASSQ